MSTVRPYAHCERAVKAPGMTDHDTVPYAELPDYSDPERLARAQAFYEAIKTRRTCRQFSDAPVAREVIEQAIQAAGYGFSLVSIEEREWTADFLLAGFLFS